MVRTLDTEDCATRESGNRINRRRCMYFNIFMKYIFSQMYLFIYEKQMISEVFSLLSKDKRQGHFPLYIIRYHIPLTRSPDQSKIWLFATFSQKMFADINLFTTFVSKSSIINAIMAKQKFYFFGYFYFTGQVERGDLWLKDTTNNRIAYHNIPLWMTAAGCLR